MLSAIFSIYFMNSYVHANTYCSKTWLLRHTKIFKLFWIMQKQFSIICVKLFSNIIFVNLIYFKRHIYYVCRDFKTKELNYTISFHSNWLYLKQNIFMYLELEWWVDINSKNLKTGIEGQYILEIAEERLSAFQM